MIKKLLDDKNSFKASLVLSVFVLLLLFVIIIFQILKLQSSGNVIVTNLNDSKDLNNLLTHLDFIEDKLQKDELSITYLDSIEQQNDSILKRLDDNIPEIQEFIQNHKSLYQQLELNLNSNSTINKSEIRTLLNKGRQLKKNFILWHSKEISNNSELFKKNNSLFPLLFILSTIIGFIILAISLYKILQSKQIIIYIKCGNINTSTNQATV